MASTHGVMRRVYNYFFLYIEPISTIVGAYYSSLQQQTYLDLTHAASSPQSGIPISTQIVLRQLSNLYLCFAINEALVLRASSDLRVWRTLIICLLIADFGHLYSVNAAGWHIYWNVLRWNAIDWGNVAFVETATRARPRHSKSAQIAKLGVHPIGTATGKDAEGLSAEVERSFGKRKASDEVPLSTDQPQKRLSVEDHFSRDEVVQALVERMDSLVAKNRDLDLGATDRDAKASEIEGSLIKSAFLEVELEKTKYLVEDKEGDIAGPEAEIEDLESQLQEIDKKEAAEAAAYYEVQSLIEKLRVAKDRVMTLEAQIEKAEQRVNVRDELLEKIQSHGRQLSETIKSGVAQLGKCDG